VAEYLCTMWLTFDPVDPEFAVAASRVFDTIWPRSSESFWRDMHVNAPNEEGMLQKLRDDFVLNLTQLSPIPNKSGWIIQQPLQEEIWWIGSKGVHERSSIIEYTEAGVPHQWTMDYDGPSPTPIRVHAEWQEVRQL
jgi:hypothetical protein